MEKCFLIIRRVLWICLTAVLSVVCGGAPAIGTVAGQAFSTFDLPAGASVTIEFDVTVNSPLPAGLASVCSQSTITGGNFSGTLQSDDPDLGGASDPTCTAVSVPAAGTGTNTPQDTVIPAFNPFGVLMLIVLILAVGLKILRCPLPGGTAVILLLLSTHSPVSGATIDDFTDPAVSATITDPGGYTATHTAAAGQITGGEREAEVWRLSGSGTVSAGLGGGLSLAVPAGSQGQLNLTYDGAGSAGLGGTDLTTGGASALRLRITALGQAGGEAGIEVLDSSGNISVAGQVLPAATGATDLFFSFSQDFTPGAGEANAADFTSVNKISVWFWVDGGTAGDTLSASLIDTVGPNLAAEKIDLGTSNQPLGATSVGPGGTIRYRITLTNTGGHATAVNVTDVIDGNTTLSGQIRSTPAAVGDAYLVNLNTTLTIAAPASGLLENDRDPDDPSGTSLLTVAAYDLKSTKSSVNNVTVAADGTFSYAPPAGFTGVDTFTYTAADNEGATAGAGVRLLVIGPTLSITYTGGNWSWTPPATILPNQVPDLAGCPYVATTTNGCNTNSTNTIRFYDNISGRRYDASITFSAADTPHRAALTDTAASGANYIQNPSGLPINFSAPGTVTFSFARKGWRFKSF